MKNYSIDLETLGTNVGDTVLSFGICEFDLKTGKIIKTLEVTFDYSDNTTIPCTLGTLRFWLLQAQENPEAVSHVFTPVYPNEVWTVKQGLKQLIKFVEPNASIWANGTKFDLGMIEHMFKENQLNIPWHHNADRCMRTLRAFAGPIDINMMEYSEIAHTALSDAIWQAKYISAAINKLGL